MHKREADLLANLGLVGADCLNVLLIEDYVVRARGQVKDTLPGHGNAMEDAEKERSLSGVRRWLVRWKILYQHGNVTDAIAKFRRQRVERLFDYLDEVFTIHSSHATG